MRRGQCASQNCLIRIGCILCRRVKGSWSEVKGGALVWDAGCTVNTGPHLYIVHKPCVAADVSNRENVVS